MLSVPACWLPLDFSEEWCNESEAVGVSVLEELEPVAADQGDHESHQVVDELAHAIEHRVNEEAHDPGLSNEAFNLSL